MLTNPTLKMEDAGSCETLVLTMVCFKDPEHRHVHTYLQENLKYH
jgi:hypothetical protein